MLHNASSTKSLFEHAIEQRIHRNDGKTCMFNSLQEICQQWQREGSVVVFTAGVFDILHLNHLLFLTQNRLLGAQEYLARNGIATPNLEQIRQVAATDAVRLIVSVDTDARVAKDKGFVAEKGNCPRPIVSWENRAMMLAHQHMAHSQSRTHPLIDLITKHGDDADSCNERGCPHVDNTYIVRNLQPDLAIVVESSQKTLSLLQQEPRISNTKIVVLQEEVVTYTDPLLGGPLKSSSIIKRAKQSLALDPNTKLSQSVT